MDLTDALSASLHRLRSAAEVSARAHPGDRHGRQPVHVVYGGAHLFRHDTAPKLGALALRSLDAHAPDATVFARALGLADGPHHEALYARVRDKLTRAPVEDLRVDFEDGYGQRAPDEEDAHCAAVAEALARGMRDGTLPPAIGVRVRSFAPETLPRALRTLDRTLTALRSASGGALPGGFTVTLPKVTLPEEVALLVDALDALGARDASVEVMVESPLALRPGVLPSLVAAARGRCAAVHFGAYDYLAACGVAGDATLTHPLCDHARHTMLVALAGTGVRLSDGATTVLPTSPSREEVHRAWRLHADHITRALAQGYAQGWDLHPAQLPARYGAVYDFFLRHADAMGKRLRAFLERAARATRDGSTFDDAATGQGMVNFFLRAVDAGALTDDEAAAHAGVAVSRLRARSFASLVEAP